MSQDTFTNGRFGRSLLPSVHWIDPAWMVGLWLAAAFLFCFQLGNVALRDWDEGIVAQVAREIWRSFASNPTSNPEVAWTWLFPVDGSGAPYFNKPPLMHWLVALSYALGGVNETTTRLPGALLTATSVPLLYWLGRELFYQRVPAVFAAAVYMTWLPVLRQGRLAMLDGAMLAFFLLMLGCLLRSRRDFRWSLGAGLGLGLMCLTKGLMGIVLGAIGLGFIAWDTPRLLTCRYLWLGLGLGLAPVVSWYTAQWLHYHEAFIRAHFMHQSLDRLWEDVDNNKGPIYYYLLEVLKYGIPWVLFVPDALRFVWRNRALSWAKLLLVWSGSYFALISGMSTKLPWYAMPLYPALALLVGAQLARLWEPPVAGLQMRPVIPRRRLWVGIFGVLALATAIAGFYFSQTTPQELDIVCVLLTLSLTLLVVAILLLRQDSQFIPVLMWGMYLSLLLFLSSDNWLWELNEAYAVKPVAQMIQKRTPPHTTLYTSYPGSRPSLNFYSDRQVLPADFASLAQHLQTEAHPYLLVNQATFDQLPKAQTQQLAAVDAPILGKSQIWYLVTRRSPIVAPPVQPNRSTAPSPEPPETLPTNL